METAILKETAHYAVVDKPSGIDSEKELPLKLQTLTGHTDWYCVHRLDKAASGLLVYAKDKETAADLSRQLQDKRLTKTYEIVVSGRPEADSGTMRDLLYKDSKKCRMYPVKRMRAGVKEAVLHYQVIDTSENEAGERLSRVAVQLETGRFHQIRAQFAARQMPVAGDRKYGSKLTLPGGGIALRCITLRFTDPESGETVEAESEIM